MSSGTQHRGSGRRLMGAGLALIVAGAGLHAFGAGPVLRPALVLVVGLGVFLAGLARSAGAG